MDVNPAFNTAYQKVASVLCVIQALLMTIAVGLRLLARHVANRKLDASDYCIAAGWLLGVPLQAITIVEAVQGGAGHHMEEIVANYGMALITLFPKYLPVIQNLWSTSLVFSKLSILVLYIKIFPVMVLVRASQAAGALSIAIGLCNTLMSFLTCQHFAYNRDTTIPGGHCSSGQVASYMATGIMNLVTDVAILTIPAYHLRQLQVPLYKRIVLVVTFGLDWVTCIISILRLRSFTSVEYSDVTYSVSVSQLSTAIESALTCILACVPLLRPVLDRNRLDYSQETPKYGSLRISRGKNGMNKKNTTRENNSRYFEPLDDDSSEVQLRPTFGAKLQGRRRLRGRTRGRFAERTWTRREG